MMLRLAGTSCLRQAMSPQLEGSPATHPKEGWYWARHSMVLDRINVLISDDKNVDAYGRLGEFLKENGRAGQLGRCATVGSGNGGVERDLIRRNMVGEIEGYDSSIDAIIEARRRASEKGYDNVSYCVSGAGTIGLPQNRFDAVFSHNFLQHVDALEDMFAEVRGALKPDGLFHLNEFVGPSRFQWLDLQIQLINDYLATLPDRLLATPLGRKPPIARPTVAHMREVHPSRAIRSGEIRQVLMIFFDILEERPYGGTLLHMGLADIAQNFDVDRPEDVAHLERFFDIEDQALATGTLPSDFTVITATIPAADASNTTMRRRAISRPVLFGMSPTRQLRPPPRFADLDLDLTVSKADIMLLADDAHYLSVGQSALCAIERAIGDVEPKNILDLPCGFGRVTRALRARFPHARMTVSDLDRAGVDFSAKIFDARAAYSVRDFRDLALGEDYDLIWVGSLITHLPALQTRNLFAALRRHLSPKGVALVTLHGPNLIPRLRQTGYGLPPGRAEAVIAEFEQTGYGYADYEGGSDLYGVSLTNDNYGISLSSESWMRANLEDLGLELANYEVQTWDNHHDIAVIRVR
jgi:SAM-dependent methyltransferase